MQQAERDGMPLENHPTDLEDGQQAMVPSAAPATSTDQTDAETLIAHNESNYKWNADLTQAFTTTDVPSNQLQLRMLLQYPDAVCNDGTPGGEDPNAPGTSVRRLTPGGRSSIRVLLVPGK